MEPDTWGFSPPPPDPGWFAVSLSLYFLICKMIRVYRLGMITLPILLGCLEECRRVIKKRTNVCDYGNHTLNFHPLPPLSQGVSAFSSLLQEYFVIAFLVGEGRTWLPMPQGTVSCVQVL